MSRGMALGVRRAITRTALALALIGIAATDATLPANATPGFAGVPGTPALLDDPNPGVPTNPDDPLCATMPLAAQCQGGPYAQSANPTSPTSTACISNPSDPVCAGGPYAPPQPPPPPAGTPPPPTAAGAPITPPPDAPIAPPRMNGGMPHEDIGGDMHDMGGMHIGGAGRR